MTPSSAERPTRARFQGDQWRPLYRSGKLGSFVMMVFTLLGNATVSTATVHVWRDGPEVQLNQEVTTGIHTEPSVLATAPGRIILVWRGHRAASDRISVVWIKAVGHGHPTDGEVEVNSNEILGSSGQPVVRGISGIGPVVAWKEVGQDGDELGISLRQFFPDLVARGPQTVANSATLGDQLFPTLAVAGDGSYFVAWEDVGVRPEFTKSDIRARIYNPEGLSRGDDIVVATTAEGEPFGPRAAAPLRGKFVVVWSANGDDGNEIFARAYDADGTAGSRFQINSTTSSEQRFADIAACTDGRSLIAWQSYGQPEDPGSGIYAQWISAKGEKLGEEIHVNAFTAGHQTVPAVAVTPDCRGVIIWQSLDQDGDSDGIFGRLLGPGGSVLSDEFPVNTGTAGSQGAYYYRTIGVAADSESSFFVAWPTSPGNDGEFDVVGQWFCVQDALRCGDATCAVADNDQPPFDVGVGDALTTLQVSVGIGACSNCRCDVDGSGRITALDALTLLRAAVGIPVVLKCPQCVAELEAAQGLL